MIKSFLNIVILEHFDAYFNYNLKPYYMNAVEIKDNSFLRQYETRVNGHLAKIEYSSQERKVFLTKLIIPEEITAKEFKEDFIKAVLSEIQEKNMRVVPTSPDIASFLRRNKRQYQEMLPVGIRI
tara:strand:- start:1876 stop:2250 length:375 start_codon:yes stop_codon:yes gene_type:complete